MPTEPAPAPAKSFLRKHIKWWLGPVVVFLLLLCIFIIMSEGGDVEPMSNTYP